VTTGFPKQDCPYSANPLKLILGGTIHIARDTFLKPNYMI